MGDALSRARGAYVNRSWRAAYDAFAAAAAESVLPAEDLERYARASMLIGNDDEYVDRLTIASRAFAAAGEPARAAECACYAAVNLSVRGQPGPASGWLSRARQLIDTAGTECVASAMLLNVQAMQKLFSGDPASARPMFEEAAAIAQRCGDPSIAAIAGLGLGQSLAYGGQITQGLQRLDEVMVSLVTDELNPIVTGMIYCGVIETCYESFEVRRAGDWTRALTRWCEEQPDLVPFRGQCLVHRAQIMQLQGSWPDATEQIELAGRFLSRPPPHPAIGAVYYEKAELARLRGDYARAEECYHLGAEWGKEPQPGLALLRLSQGRVDDARAGLLRALGESHDSTERPRLLSAVVDVDIAVADLDSAAIHAGELVEFATSVDSAMLRAMSCQAHGQVLLARGDAAGALLVLRRAWSAWQEVDAPYFAAKVRVLAGLACQQVGDRDAARMELDAARSVFDRLGAQPDLRALEQLGGIASSRQPGGLTSREVQVLRLVAAGKTNRSIATELFLSEKTVARHVANIFGKLGVNSRAAATAYAYEHDLVDRT